MKKTDCENSEETLQMAASAQDELLIYKNAASDDKNIKHLNE